MKVGTRTGNETKIWISKIKETRKELDKYRRREQAKQTRKTGEYINDELCLCARRAWRAFRRGDDSRESNKLRATSRATRASLTRINWRALARSLPTSWTLANWNTVRSLIPCVSTNLWLKQYPQSSPQFGPFPISFTTVRRALHPTSRPCQNRSLFLEEDDLGN